jgi:hypothetical protein
MPFCHGTLAINLGEDEQSSLFCAKMHIIDKKTQYITIDIRARRTILLIVNNIEKNIRQGESKT